MLDEKDIQYLQEMEKRILEQTDAKLQAMGTMILEQSTVNMQVLLEGLVDPKFNLLADGQKLIREKMLPAEALDDVVDRLDVLEAVVKSHSADIRKLKKAQ